MISSEAFLSSLQQFDFRLISGVPCSYLTPLINAAIDSKEHSYVNAANEGEAVAIATGARLGGWGGVAMFQNSGLGNAVSPLTSLNWVFRLPILLIVTWRGQPDGPSDEPQHEYMGRITREQLRVLDVPIERFPSAIEEVDPVLDRARQMIDSTGRPFALVMEKDSVAPHELSSVASSDPPGGTVSRASKPIAALEQDQVLQVIQTMAQPTDVILATTGFTGRALFACGDRPNQFYVVGSMGCASSLGLGVAMAQPGRRVIVVDGDGAMLMRLGALPAIGRQSPPNLLHVVLNNGVHDSTGGQSTLSSVVDIPQVGVSCGYPEAVEVCDLEALSAAIRHARPGLRLLHVQTAPRSDRRLPRPNVSPHDVARRLQRFMNVEPCAPSTV